MFNHIIIITLALVAAGESAIVNHQSSIGEGPPPADLTARDAWHEETRARADAAELRAATAESQVAALDAELADLAQRVDALSTQHPALSPDLYYCLDFKGGTKAVAGGEYLPIIPKWEFAQRLSTGALDWHLPDAAKVQAYIRDELKLSEWYCGRVVIDNECWTKGVSGPAIATALERSITAVRAACPRAEVWVYVPATEVFDHAAPALQQADGIYLPNHSASAAWNAAQEEDTINRVVKAASLGKPVIVQVMQETLPTERRPSELVSPEVLMQRVAASIEAAPSPGVGGSVVGICIFASADTLASLDFTRELLRGLGGLVGE